MGLEHIQEEILSRLPVKSLIRFKRVSKSWKTLISEPYFKKKHLNHAKNHNSRKLLISQSGYGQDHTFTFYSSSLSSVQLVKDIQRLDWPLNSKTIHARVYCCCDGLFLIGIWSNVEEEHPSILLLWNPATRESIVLSHSELPPSELSLYGLGYDSTSNDYKVVRIDGYDYYTPDEILVLKSGSWKKIDKTTYRSDGWLCASHDNMDGLVFVHGALHWLGCEPRFTVVSFDISNEMYGEIPLLKIMHSFTMKTGLSVLGGMLCVHCNKHETFNLWVMYDYGVKESWIKSFTIPQKQYGFCFITPIYRFPDDEVLLFCNLKKVGTVFRTFDASFRLSNRIWPLDCDDIDARTIQDGFVYTESLISPKLDH
ncbi:F-box protein CPR1-like [Lycium ferocissimum]|uniref:F-box protein CPR1-like n=1 Tax=Lycium ferocissimum TaxID=112874 RepID=UPI0028161228|nr:F-box protein CPR1-like [Lycium ferocissimum]